MTVLGERKLWGSVFLHSSQSRSELGRGKTGGLCGSALVAVMETSDAGWLYHLARFGGLCPCRIFRPSTFGLSGHLEDRPRGWN